MSNLMNILIKELREIFRDKKSLAMMLVIPILIPLLVIGMSAFFNISINKPIEEYNKIGFNYKLSEIERQIAKNMNIEVIEESTENLKEKYKNDEIALYIIKDDNKYEINGNNNDTTNYAFPLVNKYFSVYKEYLQNEYLQNNNIDSNSVLNIITISENIIDEANFYSHYIMVYGFLFIIMAITVSSTYPATDTTAGEKERGTLETLFTFPIKAKDIIIGKFLSVSISSCITGILSFLLCIVSLAIANNIFEIFKDANLMLSSSAIIVALMIIILYSFLISGLCISIASKSKSFKEAQSALTPLNFICFFPSMIVFMADIKCTHLLSFVPFINYTLVFEEVLSGTINLLNVSLMLLSTIVIITVILSIIIKQYKSEIL